MIKEELAINIVNRAQENIKISTIDELEAQVRSISLNINNMRGNMNNTTNNDEKLFWSIRIEESLIEQAVYCEYIGNNELPDNIYHYDKDILNDLVSIGKAKNQFEFSQMRSLGFGGSDFKNNVHKLQNGNLASLIYSKLNPKLNTREFHSGPLYRGHLVEPYLVKKYAESHPEETVVLTKDTWRHLQHSSVLINVDGLISYDNGETISAVLECKTSTRPELWENGIPLNYQYQLNYYLHALGLHKGILIAIICGDIQTFEFDRVDILDGVNFIESINNMDKIQDLIDVGRVKIKELGVNTVTPENITNIVRSLVDTPKIVPTNDIVHKYNDMLDTFYDKNNFIGVNPFMTGKRFVCLDIETSGFNPDHGGKIIQAAYIIIDNGVIVETGNDYFGLSELEILGGGATSEVHLVTENNIRDKVSFINSNMRNKLFNEFKNNGAILVAHNSQFEKSFLESAGIVLDSYSQVLDTRYYLRAFDPTTNGIDSLEGVCARHGIDYSGAHDAWFDTVIMVDAVMQAAGGSISDIDKNNMM